MSLLEELFRKLEEETFTLTSTDQKSRQQNGAPLDYLRRAGLVVEVIGDKLRLRPVERITDAVRQFVRNHKAEIAEALRAEEDRQARKLVRMIRKAGGSVACIDGHVHLRPADWGHAELIGQSLQAVARVTAKRQRSRTAARQPMSHTLEPTL